MKVHTGSDPVLTTMCCSLEKGIKTRYLVNPVLEIVYNTEDFSSSRSSEAGELFYKKATLPP